MVQDQLSSHSRAYKGLTPFLTDLSPPSLHSLHVSKALVAIFSPFTDLLLFRYLFSVNPTPLVGIDDEELAQEVSLGGVH